jgi:hypothetical protein
MVIFNSYVKLPEDILYILYYIIIYCIYIYTYSHHVSYMVWFKTNDCFVCNITIILITMIVWTWCFIIITSCCVCIYIYHIYTTISTCQLTSPGSLVGGIYGVEKDLVDLGPGTSRPRPESALMEKFLGKTWAQPWVAHMLHVWNMNPYI